MFSAEIAFKSNVLRSCLIGQGINKRSEEHPTAHAGRQALLGICIYCSSEQPEMKWFMSEIPKKLLYKQKDSFFHFILSENIEFFSGS